MDDLDYHLGGGDGAYDRLPECLRAHLVDEIVDHRQRHVCVNERGADFLKGFFDVAFAERAAPAHLVENPAKAVLQ